MKFAPPSTGYYLWFRPTYAPSSMVLARSTRYFYQNVGVWGSDRTSPERVSSLGGTWTPPGKFWQVFPAKIYKHSTQFYT